jgi:transcriptional/translational regulatory protein YebC/TACO1
MFAALGQIVVSGPGLADERVMNIAIEAGASDAEQMSAGDPDEDEHPSWMISTQAAQFALVKTRLEQAGLPIVDAQLALVPDNYVAVAGDAAQVVQDLVEALEDLDDVQKVYTNALMD